MYHSITFYRDVLNTPARNSWDHWHLVPITRPVFNPPSLKQNILEVPGMNGVLDMSETLTGYPVFNNREGSFEFIVMNDYWEWQEAYSAISDYLHGQQIKAILEDDPDYYYEGRFTVSSWQSEKNYSTITINYSVAPYKRKRNASEMVIDIPVMANGLPYWTISESFYGRAPTCPELTIKTTSQAEVTLRYLMIDPRTNVETLIDLEKSGIKNGTMKIPELVMYGEKTYLLFTFDNIGSLEIEDSAEDDILDSLGQPLTGVNSGTVTIRCHYGRL